MFKELMKCSKKPLLWQRSDNPFWDDEHVSAMMLEAHLDPEMDAASRRLEEIERSVQWLATMLPSGGKILDLGCGPGLYTSRLSMLGYKVTGVDLSQNSIRYAMENDPNTRYICKDYLTLEETDAYDAITLIYCDYAALTKNERAALLSKVYRMLKPGGVFLFDVYTDAHQQQKKENTQWTVCDQGGFWSADPYLCMEATYLYENHTVSATQYIVLADDTVKEYIIWDTAYNKERITAELQSAGLELTAVYGDVCGKEYNPQADTLCCVAQREG